MEKQHKVYVETFGPDFAPRYRIVDDDKGFWDGEKWNPEKAIVYYTFQEAARDLKEVQMLENEGRPIKKYTATVQIEVISDEQPTLEEVQRYLTEAAKLSLTKPTPNENDVVNVVINWGTMTEEEGLENGS